MLDSKRFYFRFSHRDTAQDKLGYQRCLDMAIAWGCEKEHIYWDFDSGVKVEREGYQKLIADVKAGLVTDIGTPNQIRLNRDSVESQMFGRLLRKHKVKLHLLESRGSLDLETTEARRQYGLDGLFAEWEYEKIQDRNLRNWSDIRNKKISIITPFGWVTDSDRKPIPDFTPTVCLLETKEIVSYADILLEIIDLVLERGSLKHAIKTIRVKYGVQRFNWENLNNQRRIRKKKLNPHVNNPHLQRKPLFLSPSGLKHLLKNPILIGTLVYLEGTDKQEIYLNNHPALISRQVFERLDKIISGKINPYLITMNQETIKARYPLAGLIYCGHCGGGCYSSKAGKKSGKIQKDYYYWRCKNITHGCASKPIRFELPETAVIAALTQKYSAIAAIALEPETEVEHPRILELRQNLTALRLLPFIDGNIQKAIMAIETEIESLGRTENVDQEVNQEREELLKSIFANALYWETLKEHEQREIYNQLVKRVVIKTDTGKAYVERVELLF